MRFIIFYSIFAPEPCII